jgi:hypothetical protein
MAGRTARREAVQRLEAAKAGGHEMTIDELRDIPHTMGHACARFRLNRHATEVGNDAACRELYTELERLYWAEVTAWADQQAFTERQPAGRKRKAGGK